MAYLVELPLDGADGRPGETVKVAIEEQPSDGLVQVARPGQVVARATRSLGELLSGVRPVAENFVDTFRGMARGPDEISIEFGLSLSAEADVVISSTSAQANFAVRLTWDRREPDDGTVNEPSSGAPVGQVTASPPASLSGHVTVPPPIPPGATV
ncbi:CU044_2847 family protein [Streptomyces olivoreticuli]